MDNPRIIHAPMNSRRYGVTAPITQYDYGYLLLPEGVELPTTYEIDFSNDEHKGTSLTVYGGSDGAEVPEELIRTGKDVFAFYYKIGEGYGKTDFTWRIPNHCRPSRDGETPTPSQQSSIDQLIVRSNEAVESAEQSAEDASASAQSAQDYAEQAESARDTAQTYANNAQASATSASQSATASANSASASAQSASEAQSASTNAETYALNSGNKAVESAQSAQASANSATQAQGFAQSASGYASNAQTSANTASTKAQDASGYAQTASTKATEASQSASQAFTYKTDAESAKGASQTAQGLAESARDSAQGYAEDAQGYAEDAQASAEGISASASQIAQNTANILKAFPTDTASGAVASFSDGADGIPLKSLIVDIDPVQDLSNGDPSPENICPISGWEGMQLNHTDENLLGGIDFANAVKASMPSASLDTTAKTITFTGTTDGNPNKIISGGVNFKENTRYTFINIGTTGNIKNVRWVYTDGTNDASSASKTGACTSASGKTVQALVKIANSSNAVVLHYEDCGIFEGVLTVDDFKPYAGQTIPISWQTEAGTVYGGKLDVLSGVMSITKYAQDMSALTWQTRYTGTTHKALSAMLDYRYARRDATKIISEKYTLVDTIAGMTNLSNPDTKEVGLYGYSNINSASSNSLYCVIDVDGELPSGLVVYDITTPIEIQLTHQQVNSLLGVNNIWADTGDTACEYRADTKLFISRLTEPDADMIADSNIVNGQYFMVGNNLYKATANIASGASVIVGTNCICKSLSEALNEINA